MKIHPLFKWFGSKWSGAKHYPAPEHAIIVEPFAGGAGYSLNYCDRQVKLWEEDPYLVGLWTWLIKQASSQDILDIPVDLGIGTDIRGLGLTLGQMLLVKHWQRTNNVGDCWTTSPWDNQPGLWNANTRARVAEEVHAVKHWELSKPIEWIDTPATWFLDPPYQFNYRYRKGLPDFDFQALESFIQTIHRGSLVIACEAVGKKGEVPTYLPFEFSHSQVTSRRKEEHSHHSKELVYVRRPSV